MTLGAVRNTLNEALQALQALVGNEATLQDFAAAGELLADSFAEWGGG